MPRSHTRFSIGRYYHLYNRGVNRQNIFFERENSLHFLRLLRRHLIEPQAAEILAYCLMPNHYHLLVRLTEDNLSEAMRRLSVSYTKAMNKRYERVGPLFQGAFRSIAVEQTNYLLNLSHYIHLNPVEAGFVARPEDWEFSSYHEYAGLRKGSLPHTVIIQSQLGHKPYPNATEGLSNLKANLQPLLLEN